MRKENMKKEQNMKNGTESRQDTADRKPRYYIAYGSNLSVEQMAVRCPDAKVVGNAILYGWQLLFKRYATIEPNPKKNTPVLVWEISEKDERNLDRYEGFPDFYYKKDLDIEVFPIKGGEPEQKTAMVYIMADGNRLCGPSEIYYRILKEGYKAFHFPAHILEQALADSIGRKEAVARLGKCSLTRPQGDTDAVTVICGGEETRWKSRAEAANFYLRCMAGSEGSEHTRYETIYAGLKAGLSVCSDDPDFKAGEFEENEIKEEVHHELCD